MVLSSAYSAPPINDAKCYRPIGTRLEVAMAKLAETMAKYYPNPTTYTPPTLDESMDNLAKSWAKLEIASKRLDASTANLVAMRTKNTVEVETTSQTLSTPPPLSVQTTITKNESTDHTFNTTTDICETKTNVIKETSSLVTKSNQLPDNTNIKLFADSTVENEVFTLDDKLKATQVLFWSSLFITLCFRCVKTYHTCHRFHPPKLVFLPTQPKPPWERRNPRYKTMILEDKDHFQDGSIDTNHSEEDIG